jgi:hypothetical protein
MTAGHWLIWAAGRTGGKFPSEYAAMAHLKTIANDHRRKPELQSLGPSAFLYIGPRGRRHGTRLIAYIGTAAGLDGIGIDTAALDAWLQQSA